MKLVAVGRTCRLDVVTVAGGEKRLASQGMVSAGVPSSVGEVEGQPFSSKNRLFFFFSLLLGDLLSLSIFFEEVYGEYTGSFTHGEYMESIRKIQAILKEYTEYIGE